MALTWVDAVDFRHRERHLSVLHWPVAAVPAADEASSIHEPRGFQPGRGSALPRLLHPRSTAEKMALYQHKQPGGEPRKQSAATGKGSRVLLTRL